MDVATLVAFLAMPLAMVHCQESGIVTLIACLAVPPTVVCRQERGRERDEFGGWGARVGG